MAYITGAYSVSYGGTVMGQTEVGFEMVGRPAFTVIRADETGRTPIDAIFTGLEDLIVRVEHIEWSNVLWGKSVPWMNQGNVMGSVMTAGTLLVGNTGPATTLILTPITGPALTGGLTWTFGKAYPLEPFREVFSAQRLRTRPTGFYVFANSVSVAKVASMFLTA